MLYIYILLSFYLFYKSYKKYAKYINILSIYILIWVLNVLLYEMKLIQYNDLTLATWLILFLNILLFSVGCLLPKKNTKKDLFDFNIEQNSLKKYIIVCIIISSLAIVPNTIMLMNHYGINILQHTTEIYTDSLLNQSIFTIPYLGSFSLLAVLLSSVYFFSFGFDKIIIFPFILSFLDILPSGSRGTLIIAFLFTITPMLVLSFNRIKVFNKKNIVILTLLCMLLLSTFYILTKNRAHNTYEQEYSTNLMTDIDTIIPGTYKNYRYFTSPIGVLNEFLKKPRFIFGINSLSVERNFINKFGGDVRYEKYQPYYDVPVHTNVGTWLTELSEDFTIPGMCVIIFFIAYFFDYIFQLYAKKRNIFLHIVFGFLSTIIYMSWFMLFIRQGNITIVMLSITFFFLFKKLSLRKKNIKSGI